MKHERILLDWLRIERGGALPIYQQISEQLRKAILNGRLTPGDRLPASRTLAADLGVSRITSLQVYEQLIAEGFLEAKRGSGTMINRNLAHVMQAGSSFTRPLLEPVADQPSVVADLIVDSDDEPQVATFMPGIPAFDTFPKLVWSRLLQRHGKQGDQFVFDYQRPGGYHPLRVNIARYLFVSRGIECSPDQIVVVGSARAAIAVTCAVLLNKGSASIVEDPGYVTSRKCLEAAGSRIVPVPVDEFGLQTDHTAMSCQAARLAYITPAHQWPTGVSLSASRRLALLEWARRHDAWIIEDDYDSEFRYNSPPVTTLHALSKGERVIYVGTFSKTLTPSIRCAYLVVPKQLNNEFTNAVFMKGCDASMHVQAALSDFIAEGHFARYIARMRKIYRHRRDLFVDELQLSFGDLIKVSPPNGGLQLVAHLRADLAAKEVSSRAAHTDIVARNMAEYYINNDFPNALHLGFGAVSEHKIGPAVKRFRQIVDDMLCA